MWRMKSFPLFLLSLLSFLSLFSSLLVSKTALSVFADYISISHHHDNVHHRALPIDHKSSNFSQYETVTIHDAAAVNDQQQQQQQQPPPTPSPEQTPPPPQPLPQTVQLLRIPKAGSSSFSAFLRLQYNCTSQKFPPGDCTVRYAKACPNIRGCVGHTPPKMRDRYPYVTMFRHPMERYISAYYYKGHHGLGTNGNITLHTQLYPEWNNTMTRYLSGLKIGTWEFNRTSPPPNKTIIDEEELDRRLDVAVHLTTEKRTVFVGLAEFWNDSIRLFCRLFQCPNLEASLKAPKSRTNRNMTNESTTKQYYPYNDTVTMEHIRYANRKDTVLYRAAQHQFCIDLNKYQRDAPFWTTLSKEVVAFCKQLLAANAVTAEKARM